MGSQKRPPQYMLLVIKWMTHVGRRTLLMLEGCVERESGRV